jgi:hypothetical protein
VLLHALDRRLDDTLNACAPGAVRQRQFASSLGRVLRRPAVVPTPAFALRLVLGGFASELLASKRVIPQRTLESGYAFRFPQLEAALRDALRRPAGG